MTSGTANRARPIDPRGDLYQQRAFQALPLLVRQAHAGQTINYGDLASELKMQNARNLNYVLGAVGSSLVELGHRWGEEIPPLQALVINRRDGMPGPGFVKSLVDAKVLSGATRRTRKQVIDGKLAAVFTYPRWTKVLADFGQELASPSAELSRRATAFRGGAESDAHKDLMALVAKNPHLVGAQVTVLETVIEYRLPTGDEIDVYFRTRRGVTAVEVKSIRSPEDDIVRGVYQCVKYEALLNALAASTGTLVNVESILVLGGSHTPATRALANTLGISVVEEVGEVGNPMRKSGKVASKSYA